MGNLNPPSVRRSAVRQSPAPICDWAERSVTVGVGSRRGNLRLDPYQRGILDACTDPGIEAVGLMMSSQVGKSLMASVLLGWAIAEAPQPILIMHATQAGLNKFTREKLEPMFAGAPSVNRRVKRNNRGALPPDGFAFDGGYCTMTTARSIGGKHGTTASLVIADEVDDYEGETAMSSLVQRMASYGERTLVAISTPTMKGGSAIETEFLAGTREEWQVVCPLCGAVFVPDWQDVAPPGTLICRGCDAGWTEGQRIAAVRAGRWLAMAPEVTGRRSFHLSQLVSVNTDLATTWRTGMVYSPEDRATQIMAEPYLPLGRADITLSQIRRGEPDGWTPAYAAVGVDVQGNRLEWAWVECSRNYAHKYLRAAGVVERQSDAADTFRALQAQLAPVARESGLSPRVAVDGGWDYEWVKMGVTGAMGMAYTGESAIVEIVRGYVQPSFRKPIRGGYGQGRAYLWVSVDEAKYQVATDLESGALVVSPTLSDARVAQLCSESMVEEVSVKGNVRAKWVLKGRSIRNELLDTVVYGYAALLGHSPVESGPALVAVAR